MSHATELIDKAESSQKFETKIRRLPFGCITKLAVAVLVIGSALYGVSIYLAPDIPEELTRRLNISAQNDPELANVPETAITFGITNEMIAAAEHPLDPVLTVARKGLEVIDANVHDYTAVMQKQVRIDGELGDEGFMKCKIRHAREEDGEKIPLSVYTYFLKPKSLAGQEAIWVDGKNDGKLVAHLHGLLNVARYWLPITNPRVMEGNLHPISNMGMRNLVVLLIEKGTRDREHGECSVQVTRNVDVGGHICTLIEVTHPKKRDYFEFHIAKIYIDDVRNLPIAYEGYLWPKNPGGEPQLLEKYYYTNIELNVELTDEDFDPDNKAYHFPKLSPFR